LFQPFPLCLRPSHKAMGLLKLVCSVCLAGLPCTIAESGDAALPYDNGPLAEGATLEKVAENPPSALSNTAPKAGTPLGNMAGKEDATMLDEMDSSGDEEDEENVFLVEEIASAQGDALPKNLRGASAAVAEITNTTLQASSVSMSSFYSTSAVSLEVWCVCRDRSHRHVLRCGHLYYTLFQCDPVCPSVCRSMRMKYRGCVGPNEVQWFHKLNYRWTDCAGSPLR